MVNRREPRKDIRVFPSESSVRTSTQPFNENVFTVNVSRSGAMVIEIKPSLRWGRLLAWSTVKPRAATRCAGRRPPNGPSRNTGGLETVQDRNVIWDFPYREPGSEDTARARAINERRRIRADAAHCRRTAPCHPGKPHMGPRRDISLGGCFVEMSSPLKEGTKLRLALWIRRRKSGP